MLNPKTSPANQIPSPETVREEIELQALHNEHQSRPEVSQIFKIAGSIAGIATIAYVGHKLGFFPTQGPNP